MDKPCCSTIAPVCLTFRSPLLGTPLGAPCGSRGTMASGCAKYFFASPVGFPVHLACPLGQGTFSSASLGGGRIVLFNPSRSGFYFCLGLLLLKKNFLLKNVTLSTGPNGDLSTSSSDSGQHSGHLGYRRAPLEPVGVYLPIRSVVFIFFPLVFYNLRRFLRYHVSDRTVDPGYRSLFPGLCWAPKL